MQQNNNGNNSSSMSSNTKHLLIAAAAIVVVIAVAIIVPHLHTSTTATTTTPVAAATMQTPATAQVSMTTQLAAWNAELAKYNGNMIVFAGDCTATPITQTHKKGDTLLLVNNSNVSHAITVVTMKYTVGGLHYKEVYLPTTGTSIVNCDARADTANIIVD
jgi:hypothetical protein